jgi:hypothetical protein
MLMALCKAYSMLKYEFIDFRSFSEVLGGPARYVHFLELPITYGDLPRKLAAGLTWRNPGLWIRLVFEPWQVDTNLFCS